MRLDRRFGIALLPQEVDARAARHFSAAGYTQTSARPPFTFARGSVLGSATSLDPRRWQVSATVQLQPMPGHVLVSVAFEINTSGHPFITPSEQRYWDSEAAAVERAIVTGVTDVAGLAGAAAATSGEGARYLVVIVLAIGVFITCYLLFRMYFGGGLMGAVIGGGIGGLAGWLVVRLAAPRGGR